MSIHKRIYALSYNFNIIILPTVSGIIYVDTGVYSHQSSSLSLGQLT